LLENEVGGLFVHADHQRQGIGRQLMDFAAERKGTLTLEVFEENAIGRSFYEKYGFIKLGEVMDEEIGRNQFKMALL
jgi:putative acetyltransferase